MVNALALLVYELGERATSLRDAVKIAAKHNYSVVIMPVFCRDETEHMRVVLSRDDLMKRARDLFQMSSIGEIYVSPNRIPSK